MEFRHLKLLAAMGRLGGIRDGVREYQEYVANVFVEYMQITGDCQFPFQFDEVIKAALKLRKGNNLALAEAAFAHQSWQCFWKNRGKGECSTEVHGGHVAPAYQGNELTVENCMIECSAHNMQRGKKTIEEYLLSDDRT